MKSCVPFQDTEIKEGTVFCPWYKEGSCTHERTTTEECGVFLDAEDVYKATWEKGGKNDKN